MKAVYRSVFGRRQSQGQCRESRSVTCLIKNLKLAISLERNNSFFFFFRKSGIRILSFVICVYKKNGLREEFMWNCVVLRLICLVNNSEIFANKLCLCRVKIEVFDYMSSNIIYLIIVLKTLNTNCRHLILYILQLGPLILQWR